jgi:hypothetical protein
MHLDLQDEWNHSLIATWRKWLKANQRAAMISFLTTEPCLNPGGWTNFFSSNKFDYLTTATNRKPWFLPDPLREALAKMDIFNHDQFTQRMSESPTSFSIHLSQTNREAIRLYILAQEERGRIPTNPPLRNPWDEPAFRPIGPWPKNSYRPRPRQIWQPLGRPAPACNTDATKSQGRTSHRNRCSDT